MKRASDLRVVATVEARMGSSRLPGKVLSPVLGRPLLALLIERLQRAARVDAVVVATTEDAADDAIASLAAEVGAGCFRGSEADVLDRVLCAARHAGADVIVEITGDCPLIDPAIVDEVVAVFLGAAAIDYASNSLSGKYPNGMDVQVFTTALLERVSRLTADPADREHVSLYIYEHPEQFSIREVGAGVPEEFRDVRLTVDTAEDLALVRGVFEALYPETPAFSLTDVLDLLGRRPDLLTLNQHVRQRPVRVPTSQP